MAVVYGDDVEVGVCDKMANQGLIYLLSVFVLPVLLVVSHCSGTRTHPHSVWHPCWNHCPHKIHEEGLMEGTS